MSKHIDLIAFIINYHTKLLELISSLVAADGLEYASDIVTVADTEMAEVKVVGESKSIAK